MKPNKMKEGKKMEIDWKSTKDRGPVKLTSQEIRFLTVAIDASTVASEKHAKSLSMATWVLSAATIGLFFVTLALVLSAN